MSFVNGHLITIYSGGGLYIGKDGTKKTLPVHNSVSAILPDDVFATVGEELDRNLEAIVISDSKYHHSFH